MVVSALKLELVRKEYTNKSTIGELFIDNIFYCYTLEPITRLFKIPGYSVAIPAGEYEIDLTQSGRFKESLPLLLDVPNYEGIRIHAGNSYKDTEGCILVGRTKSENYIYSSRVTLDELVYKIKLVKEKSGRAFIKIINTQDPHNF